jgi:hypothetical protein
LPHRLFPHPHPFPHAEAIAIEWHDNDGIQGGYNQVGAKLLAERLVSITSGKLAGGTSTPRACLSWIRGKHASRIGVLEEKAQEASADVSLTDGSSGSSASASAATAAASDNANAKANANANANEQQSGPMPLQPTIQPHGQAQTTRVSVTTFL